VVNACDEAGHGALEVRSLDDWRQADVDAASGVVLPFALERSDVRLEDIGLRRGGDRRMMSEHLLQPRGPAARRADEEDEVEVSERHCPRAGARCTRRRPAVAARPGPRRPCPGPPDSPCPGTSG